MASSFTINRSRSKKLLGLIEQFTPLIRAAFLAAIQDVKSTAVLTAIIEAIEAGDLQRAFRSLGFSEAAMRPLTLEIERAFEAGGMMVADSIPGNVDGNVSVSRAVFRFDVRNSRAEAWLRDHSSTLVTRITTEQMEAVRTSIQSGMTAGTNPRTIALDLVGRIDPTTQRRVGGIVGLSAPQERYVANARRELSDPTTASKWFSRDRRDARFDSIVQRSITTGEPLDAATIQRLTGKYADSLLQLRGETIARTEALQSLNQSQDEAFRQAIDQGVVNKSAVKRVWDSTGNDGRTRDTHLEMEGQTVGLDEPFTTPGGDKLMFPGDWSLGAPPEEIINCRCRVRMDVDFLAGVK
jgi:hypothetical protein